ncbi:MAG: TauD/TfdA family dioxygenase, partial [SAR324 cluster bacterium]|nr:TauD/TfdA family dioxygenase [SAR324 cluster bacterium]
MELKTRQLDESFALEVLELELDQVDDESFAALKALWQEHPLLLLRRQFLSEPDLLALSRRFGELDILVREDLHSPLHPEIIYVTNLKNENGERLGGLGSYELNWHTDQSYRENPATGSIFYGVEMPEDQGRTSWCNTQMSYEALPPQLQQELQQLQGVTKYN